MSSEKSYAQIAYEAHGDSLEWKTFPGIPMLQWGDLESKIQEAWEDSANAVLNIIKEDFLLVVKEDKD